MKTVTVTCRTPDCPANGVPVPGVPAEYDIGDGPQPVGAFACGACGQLTDDVTDD